MIKLIKFKNLKGVKTMFSKFIGRVVAQPLFYIINHYGRKQKIIHSLL
jgi:hypothetical protein